MLKHEKRVALESDWDVYPDCPIVIRNPGRFEGEPLWAPYYWDVYMNGGADDDDGGCLSFDVSEDDRVIFPELADVARVEIYQRDDGFISSATIRV